MANGRERLEMQPVTQPSHDFVQIDDIIQLMRFVWRRKWLIALGTTAGLLLGGLYYTLSVPVYEAKAKVLVMKKEPRGSSGDSRLYYFEDDVATHASVITSPWFIRNVIDQRGLASLPSLAESKDPARAVAPRLTVMRQEDEESSGPSSILDLSFQSPVPQDCGIILTAVIERYQGFLEESTRSVNEDALRLITQKAEDAHKELQEKEAEYQDFRKQAPLLWNGERGTGWYQERLANLESKRSDLTMRRAEAQSRFDALRGAVREGGNSATVAAMLPEAFRRESSSSLERELLPLLLQEKTLRKDFGPGHPDVLAIRDQIQFTRSFLDPTSTARNGPAADENHPSRLAPDPVESYLQSLQQDLADIEASEQALDQRIEQEKKEAKEASYHEFLDRQYSGDVARIQQYYDSLLKQLQGVDLNKDLVGYSMRVIAPVGVPVQVAPNTMLIFTLAGFLGIVAGFGLGWTAESRDKSLRSLEEIRRRLGMPVVGCIPLMIPKRQTQAPAGLPGGLLDPLLRTYHQPDSAEAEAYRAVRAALYVGTRDSQQRVIQITSSNAGDGKTTLAANLAISIAQSGKSVLLVDADLRRPRIDQLFGCPADVGLTSVIHGDAELPDATQLSGVEGLWLLPSGPLPSNPADLLVAPKFQQFLDVARRQYDFVLIDTPALLVATDARVVAPWVDAVLLSLRVVKNGGPQLVRAKEILDQLEVNLLGVVVNATDRYAEFGGSSGYYTPSASTRPYCNAQSPQPPQPIGQNGAKNKVAVGD